MSGNNVGAPPQPEEIEVTLFGPGYGECVLLHLGYNEWVIIDSCLDRTKRPPVLDYLRNLGLDPVQCVQLLVATHWHDDHIGGLGTIIQQCQAARFVCSGALKSTEFLTLVRAASTNSMMRRSGVKEFSDVLDTLEARSQTKHRLPVPTLASAHKILWNTSHTTGRAFVSEMRSLSPSDAAITRTQLEIAALLPKPHEPKRRVSPRSPNHAAVVVWATAGQATMLFGSDLEESGESDSGWIAILDSPLRPTSKASLFKVPHHGSATADHPRVWTDLLDDRPHAILTPFVLGRIVLPQLSDVTRLNAQTPNAFITAKPKERPGHLRSSIVEKTIKETVRAIRELPSAAGFIRLRCKALDPVPNWSVQLFPTALPLSNW